MTNPPLPNGANGRGPGGRFLRSALLKAVRPQDLKEVVSALLDAAKRARWRQHENGCSAS